MNKDNCLSDAAQIQANGPSRAGIPIWAKNAAYTVVREIREETGLDVKPTRLMGIFSPRAAWVYPNGDSTQSVVSIFRCQLVGGVERADQVETSQLAWLSPQEILALPEHPLLTSFNQRVIQHLDDGWFVL